MACQAEISLILVRLDLQRFCVCGVVIERAAEPDAGGEERRDEGRERFGGCVGVRHGVGVGR